MFGITQQRILPGAFHWVIQVAHLFLGLVAMGLAERLARGAQARLSQRLGRGVRARRAGG